MLLASGVGLTDLVKRPSARAHELSSRDVAHGRDELRRKIASLDVPLLIFTYKKDGRAPVWPV